MKRKNKMVKKQAKTATGAKMSGVQDKAYIENALRTHKPNVKQMKESIARRQQKEKFLKKELALIKEMSPASFTKQSGYEYEKSESYGAFLKEARFETIELELEFLSANLEEDIETYELESKKVKLLESGVWIGGMSDEQILKQ